MESELRDQLNRWSERVVRAEAYIFVACRELSEIYQGLHQIADGALVEQLRAAVIKLTEARESCRVALVGVAEATGRYEKPPF